MTSLIPNAEEMKAIEIMTKNAADSKQFGNHGGYSNIFLILLYARELGIPIMSALFGGIHIIAGKAMISAQMMNLLIRKAGHSLDIKDSPGKCTITGKRKDTGAEYSASFSLEDAKRAGIYKGNWEKYPEDMCFARALSRIARRLFPDIIGKSYVEGEIEGEIENDPADRKSLRIDEPMQEAEAEVMPSKEEIVKQFYTEFADLNKKLLENTMAKDKEPEERMKRILKDTGRFRKWFIDEVQSKELTDFEKEALKAVNEGFGDPTPNLVTS